MKHLFLFVFLIFASVTANAEIRPIFIPGKLAVVLMQGVSSSGFDPEPRALYDALAIPAQPQSGGEGKGLKTQSEDFILVCGTKGTTRENVVCTINIKPSDRTKIDYLKQIADVQVTGPEAVRMHQECAGAGKSEPFAFATHNGWVRIESTPELFHFHFEK